MSRPRPDLFPDLHCKTLGNLHLGVNGPRKEELIQFTWQPYGGPAICEKAFGVTVLEPVANAFPIPSGDGLAQAELAAPPFWKVFAEIDSGKWVRVEGGLRNCGE